VMQFVAVLPKQPGVGLGFNLTHLRTVWTLASRLRYAPPPAQPPMRSPDTTHKNAYKGGGGQ
jgi:hypothetical protein